MVQFQFLDWFWLAAYVAIMVGCGILFYRLGKRSMADFFLASDAADLIGGPCSSFPFSS